MNETPNDSSMNQDKDLKVQAKRGEGKKAKTPFFNGMLGWVFRLDSIVIRALAPA